MTRDMPDLELIHERYKYAVNKKYNNFKELHKTYLLLHHFA